jgi:ABC-type Mn2+/Zn2+ transport system permease subunit
MLGMYFSVQFDLPTGATIVCTFGLALAAMAVVRPLVRRRVIREAGVVLNAPVRR